MLVSKKRTDVGLGVLYNPSLGSVLIRAIPEDLSGWRTVTTDRQEAAHLYYCTETYTTAIKAAAALCKTLQEEEEKEEEIFAKHFLECVERLQGTHALTLHTGLKTDCSHHVYRLVVVIHDPHCTWRRRRRRRSFTT